MNRPLGTHGLLDLHGCPPQPLRDAALLQTLLEQAAGQCGATVLSAHFHTFGGGGGVTGVLLLAESHISIHTWPEHGFAAADIFMCGTPALQTARMLLQNALGARRVKWTAARRGELLLSD